MERRVSGSSPDKPTMDTIERYKGCLLGLAVGDALGTTLEFSAPGSFKPITDMIGGGPFNLEPGQWTDDTSMALCLVDSLVTRNGFDPRDQLERYILWYRSGYLSSTGTCFDIGLTTLNRLMEFEKTGRVYGKTKYAHSAGNGSLMRLAPVPMFFLNDAQAIKMCGESSKTTHANKLTVSACEYFGGLLIDALNGISKKKLLSKCYPNWKRSELPREIYKIANGSFKYKEPPEIRGTGYVVESLEAALWAFHKSHTFEEGCLLAANLGDDADTTAAIYGQIAGAYYGVDQIPVRWLNKLFDKENIEQYAADIYNTTL